jgi:hypothetical protein
MKLCKALQVAHWVFVLFFASAATLRGRQNDRHDLQAAALGTEQGPLPVAALDSSAAARSSEPSNQLHDDADGYPATGKLLLAHVRELCMLVPLLSTWAAYTAALCLFLLCEQGTETSSR